MVFFYISKYVTKWIGPTLFRNGLRLRNRLTRTQTTSGVELASMNNYWMDLACMIPYSQKLLSLAIYDESRRLALEFRKQYQHDQQKESKTDGKAVASSSPSRSDDAMATISMITDPAAIRRLSNMRIGVLDDYLRPSLIPNDLWTDVERNWRYNTRIVAWARKEFLISKYGPYIQEAMVAYPKLQDSPQISTSSSKGGSGGSKRRFLLDLVHRGEINTDNIGGGPVASVASPFLRLPTSDVIAKAFRMKGWTNVKSPERVTKSLVPIVDKLGGSVIHQHAPDGGRGMTKHVDIPVETDVSSLGLEDALEVVTKGYVKHCGPLNALCLEANFYQFYSREYVQQLGDYLLKRTAARRMVGGKQQQNGQQDNNCNDILNETPLLSTEAVVLDIGAGDGLLMQCLRDYMERKVLGLPLVDGRKGDKRKNNQANSRHKKSPRQPAVIPTMVATDDMSWRIFPKADVEKLSVEQALEKYTGATSTSANKDIGHDLPESLEKTGTNEPPQVIVLCSWMPMGQDWTSYFRNAEVDEYILIGEADDGSCGDNWLTWGNPVFYDHESIQQSTNDENDERGHEADGSNVTSPIPLYEKEGYQRSDMNTLTDYQFSSFDLSNSKSSKTVSFRRKKKIKG